MLTTLGLCLLLLITGPARADSGDDPEDEVKGQLERMAHALRTLNYSGIFVYFHGDQLETLMINHVVQGGRELERLVSLNGVAREVRRNPSEVTCVMPDVHAVSVEQRASRTGLWPALRFDMGRLNGQYLLHPLGHFRVAGRNARVVGIIPKDRYRYGYRFYLDEESGLPLKTDLMDEDANSIEQIMFTSLELLADGVDPVGDPPGTEQFRTLKRVPPQSPAPDQPRNWVFRWLPAGFDLHAHTTWSDDDGHPLEHFVLSDGLASVSVYVERGPESGLQGGAHVGAVNAWGGRVAEHQITAVGEVPEQTVRRVVESMHWQRKDTDG